MSLMPSTIRDRKEGNGNSPQFPSKQMGTNSGGKLLNSEFSCISDVEVSWHCFSPTKTPQYNGFHEQANSSIIEKEQCNLNGSKLPHRYWEEAVNTDSLLLNLIPTLSWHKRSLCSLWKSAPPQIRKLQVCGSHTIIFFQKPHWDQKLGTTGAKGILLRYEN
ncbi:hypothetical protein O181_105660 [Austropuccinia psidii MF-1]|uniref:Integrase catalytic domain-containing protein n=1 Tax=Austropuccinia psidii MF-1 TaxID=1389203 RepID=A0A9Q3JQX6_9BASI|nr:hypothetical protein [Austropuccinia psidii MF-1]